MDSLQVIGSRFCFSAESCLFDEFVGIFRKCRYHCERQTPLGIHLPQFTRHFHTIRSYLWIWGNRVCGSQHILHALLEDAHRYVWFQLKTHTFHNSCFFSYSLLFRSEICLCWKQRKQESPRVFRSSLCLLLWLFDEGMFWVTIFVLFDDF